MRADLVPTLNVPGPGKYQINGDFERAQDRPKFHMGIKTHSFTGKNLDMPGPGEYETDVIPIHHSNLLTSLELVLDPTSVLVKLTCTQDQENTKLK